MDPVIVVGAGLAGLHAAWRIDQAGRDVVVLEARDRVGGRTWSDTLPDGTVFERGGEFIAPDHDVLRSLAAELGLELVPHGFSFDRRPTPEREAPSVADLVAAATWAGGRASQLADDVAAIELLPPEDKWSSAQTAVLERLETSLTVPLAEVSARVTFSGRLDLYDPAVRFRDGNQAVALELARRLGDRVRLETPVAAVHQSAEATSVIDGTGQEHRAVAVVLALPLPLLLELDLQPGLPDGIRGAVGRTRFGDAAKLHIPLAKHPVPGGVASPDARWWCWTSQAADGGRLAAPVLSCFAGGERAIEMIDAQAALALRPDVTPDLAGPVLTHWGGERWTRGSYSAPGIGLTPEDNAAWTQAWGSVAFAGEHTAGDLAATMNGAAASGSRAAETVLVLLRDRATV